MKMEELEDLLQNDDISDEADIAIYLAIQTRGGKAKVARGLCDFVAGEEREDPEIKTEEMIEFLSDPMKNTGQLLRVLFEKCLAKFSDDGGEE